jgi:hypothetical protein
MRGQPIVQKSSNITTGQASNSIPASDLTWLVLMMLVMLSAVVAQIYAYIPKFRQRQSSKMTQRHETTCHRCKYFHNNLYLKCALHPDTVLTEASIDCTDYCSKK